MQVEKYNEKMPRPVIKNCVVPMLLLILATVDVVCSIVYACNQLGCKSLSPPCKLFTILSIVFLAVYLFCVYVGVCCNKASYFFLYTVLLVLRLLMLSYSFLVMTGYAVFGDSDQQGAYINSKCVCSCESDYVSASEVYSELLQRMGLGLLYIAWSLVILTLIIAVTAQVKNSSQVGRRRVEEQV